MTIASKLLYCRRTPRPSRGSVQELDLFDADRDAAGHLRGRLPRDRRCGRSQRRPDDGPSRARHLVHPRAARTLQESFVLNKSTTEFGEGNCRIGWCASDGVAHSSRVVKHKLDDQLPGSVLQARTRLLERLRGVYLTESRQENPATDISKYEFPYSDKSSTSKCSHWKTATALKLLESGDPVAEMIFQTEQVLSLHDTDKKPCAISHCLEEEVFIDTKGDGIPKSLMECSICLKKFLEGEGVIRLQCGHRFHHACLEPWMQAHELCPYCRASVVG